MKGNDAEHANEDGDEDDVGALFHDFEGVDRPEEPVRVGNSGSGGDKRRLVSGGVSMYLCLFLPRRRGHARIEGPLVLPSTCTAG